MANNKFNNQQYYKTNGEIFINGNGMVRVVGDNIESKICHITEAKKLASSMGLDLIEINRTSSPVIVKIEDYSKFLYELKKKAKQQLHNTKPLKEIQLSVSIAKNDLLTKANNAKKFILDGSKVKVILTMKGREKARREENKKSIYEFIALMEDVAIPESIPKDESPSKTTVILKKKQR